MIFLKKTPYDIGIDEYTKELEAYDISHYGDGETQTMEELFKKSDCKIVHFEKPLLLLCFGSEDFEDEGKVELEIKICTEENEKVTLYTDKDVEEPFPFSAEVMMLVVEDKNGVKRKFRFNSECYHIEEAEENDPGITAAVDRYIINEKLNTFEYTVFTITHN